MPEKHLFVNSSHYQDRPDPNMRHKIASHAAKYGPNGSLAFKTSPERTDEVADRSTSRSSNKSSPSSTQSNTSTPRVHPVSLASTPSSAGDVFFRQDYESMSSRFSDFCICADDSPENSPGSKRKAVHAGDCSILDDYLTLTREHELPFRVATHFQRSATNSPAGGAADGLVLQCLLVAGQAAIDGMSPKFKNKPSNQTLALQQKALNSMRGAISLQHHSVEDSIVIASAIMLSVAAFYADHDAYKAHHSSLQRLIELQGGFNQTRAHGVVKALMAGGEISLAHHRYMAAEQQITPSKKDSSPPQFPTQAPFKLKYPMPPFAPEITSSIDRMSSGFQTLAKASKLSIQALQLLHLANKWSLVIDQSPKSDAEERQLLANTAGANARLINLYDDSVQTKRMAALLLVSLPTDAAHMRLERSLCLGFLNLLHSVTLRPHPTPLRDRLVIDFADSIFSLHPKDSDEEDCMIWLALAVASEWRHCAAKMKASPLPALHGHDTVILSQMWIQKSRQVMDWLIVKCERARTWDEVMVVCSRFLWLRRLGPEWKQTWKEAMERRLRNMPRKKSRS